MLNFISRTNPLIVENFVWQREYTFIYESSRAWEYMTNQNELEISIIWDRNMVVT